MAHLLMFLTSLGSVVRVSCISQVPNFLTHCHLRFTTYFIEGPELETMTWCMRYSPITMAHDIIHTLVLHDTAEDKRIWRFTGDGQYTVKLGYRLYCDAVANKAQLKIHGHWASVWKLQVPPKVRSFLWRVLWGCLPTRMNLRQRHVNVDGVCPYCARGLENAWHLLFGCSFAEACWRKAKLWHYIEDAMFTVSSFQDLVFRMLDILPDDQTPSFVTYLWSARNGKIWEQRHTRPTQILQGAAFVMARQVSVNQQWTPMEACRSFGFITKIHQMGVFPRHYACCVRDGLQRSG